MTVPPSKRPREATPAPQPGDRAKPSRSPQRSELPFLNDDGTPRPFDYLDRLGRTPRS
jgi:hypothetical protein